MRFYTALLFLLVARVACAQNDVDPEVARVQAEVARVRTLVEAGVAPPLQLQKAEAGMADAQDAAILRKTIYGKDLTEAQSDDMLAAANRRLERRRQEYEQAKKLVDAGATARNSLDEPRAEIDTAAKEYGLAESRAALVHELARMASEEEELAVKLTTEPAEAPSVAERHDGDGVFDMVMFAGVETAYERQFGASLPVSAMGQTAVHRAMGFDHSGRVDVALNPDSAAGEWLRTFLTVKRIPFFVFRQAIPGKATGAHIHIGPVSTHLASGG
jgi:multidrug resistance efflux pump